MNSVAETVWDSEELKSLRTLVVSGQEPPGGGPWKVPGQPGRPPYLAWLTPLRNGNQGAHYHVLTIYDPEHGVENSRECLLAAYRFTRAEMRLVEQLLAGRTPVEAAQTLGVTIHTVRTYLKRLFQKVGVKSQATLVRRLYQVATAGSPQSPAAT